MRHLVDPPHSAHPIETEHRQARAAHERLTGLTSSLNADEPEGIELETALDAAEADYRAALEAMKTDSSDTTRWRCARALIEFDRLSDLMAARRIR